MTAGVPQGTKLGPWLFLIMINDLGTSADMWKYVDDISVSEIGERGRESELQVAVVNFATQSSREGFHLSETKCKNFRIGFSNTTSDFDPIVLNGKPLEIITSAKLLGLNLTSDLKWNTHTSELIRKASPRQYFLRQLKRCQVAPKELTVFYTTYIRPILEYACPVFHRPLPEYLSDDLERIQRRALKIIHSDLSYSEALKVSVLQRLHERRESITTRLYHEVTNNPCHKLHSLLPKRNGCKYSLRNKRTFVVPRCKTDRFKSSFFLSQLYS